MSPKVLIFTFQVAGVAMFILGISAPVKADGSGLLQFQNPATVKHDQGNFHSLQNRGMTLTLNPEETDTPSSDALNPPNPEVPGEPEADTPPSPKGEEEDTNSDALAPPNTDSNTDTEPNSQQEYMTPNQSTEPQVTPSAPGNQNSHNNTFNFELNLGGGGSSTPFGDETMPQPLLEEFPSTESLPNMPAIPPQVTPQTPSLSSPMEGNELKPTQERKHKHKQHKRQKKERQRLHPEHLQLRPSDQPVTPETRPGRQHRRRHPLDLKRRPLERRPSELQPRLVPKPRILRPQLRHHSRPRVTHPPKRQK
jgi:hypothetical protein